MVKGVAIQLYMHTVKHNIQNFGVLKGLGWQLCLLNISIFLLVKVIYLCAYTESNLIWQAIELLIQLLLIQLLLINLFAKCEWLNYHMRILLR